MKRVLSALVLAAITGPPGALAAQDATEIGAAIAAACGVAVDPAAEAVLAGTVSDSVSGVPLPRAKVRIVWQTPGDTMVHVSETETDARGFYAFCAVPAGTRVVLGATARVSSHPVEVEVEAGMLHLEPIRLLFSDSGSRGGLVGRIVDAELRRPVPDALVRLRELDRATTTNPRGYFTFGDQPWGVYTLEITSLGYAPLTTGVRVAGSLTQNVEILLKPDALKLEGITVTVVPQAAGREIEGLIRRMTLGFGQFITREVIERRPGAMVADLIQEVPGVSVRRGLYGRVDLEVRGKPCQPDVFVDGMPWLVDPEAGLNVHTGEIEAVEVYKGVEVPWEFLRVGRNRFPCAVIAVWTRRGG